MRFVIKHETNYQFDEAIFLEPHFLRFKPSNEPHLTLDDFQMNISPLPAGHSEQMDVENNVFHFCWFEGLHKALKVSTVSRVEVVSFNPFNYLIYPEEFLTIPFTYPNQQKKLLHSSLAAIELSEEMRKYANELLENVNGEVSTFLLELTKRIHKDFKVETREEGDPLSPRETFELRNGSCRDLTWMQIHLLRNLGIAAKFVSGYYYLEAEKPVFELHAWLEVYIPGAGWLGFDPSHGVAVGYTHVPVAKSAHYENTMPVIGTVRGEARSSLSFSLHIEAEE